MNGLNKTALRNFAVSARKDLIERVELQALKIGVTKEKVADAQIESSDAIIINGNQLTDLERKQRNQLIHRIEDKGYEQVIEEVAYTWFNRFVALRFMEVNDYLPTRVRVLSSENPSNTEPDMIKEALTLDLDMDKEKVFELDMASNTEALFKYLIQLHCNDLNKYMPFMFETLEDYMMILFPEGLLGTESFVREMIDTDAIPENNWQEIEIVGWLYQFYIADEKDRVFREKGRYKSADIPFATQLFTPKWIVKYMVQNSLGKYWIESHPEDERLIDNWDFYIDNTDEKYEEVKKELVNSELRVEDITCLDPAMGSGHILVYMFDVLHEIYTERGYMSREIPKLIIENNLYGLDIDERAYQLAGFSIIMKALEYNRRFLRTIEREGLTLNIAAIEESNSITEKHLAYLNLNDNELAEQYINQFKDAKSIGSLLKLTQTDTSDIEKQIDELSKTPVKDIFDEEIHNHILSYFPKLLKQTNIMSNKYDVIVMNPPYMGRSSINSNLTNYIKEHYPDCRENLFAPFMKLDHLLKGDGILSIITQQSWMFLNRYKELRKEIINHKNIESMLHLGPRAFDGIGGEIVQTTTFILRPKYIANHKGIYIRLADFNTAKEKEVRGIDAINNQDNNNFYRIKQEEFLKIPGNPISYWATKSVRQIYNDGVLLKEISNPRQGLATGNNDRFIREWFEVSNKKIGYDYDTLENARSSDYKWFPLNKGGPVKKWYGNNESVIAFDSKNYNLLKKSGNRLPSRQFYFKEGLTWSKVSSSRFGVRYSPQGFIFTDAGMKIFVDDEQVPYLCCLLNSKLVDQFLSILSETMNYEKGNIERIPVIAETDRETLNVIETLFYENIGIAKSDWNSFETSWNYKTHPLLKHKLNTLESSFYRRKDLTENQFNQLKINEEELNRIFIEIYDLKDDLSVDVADKDVTVHKADLELDIKSFISYAVGCALGRYSLDEDGLIYAGGEFDSSRYETFPADENNILPILPGAYFEDDIVSFFINFVETTYGPDTLEENLLFVAEAIGKRKNETAREAIRRYFLNNFYRDHVQTYKRHPIYWLFTSGREKAFNCLIYMHRYDKTTLSRIRTDYLHDVQARYETEKSDLQYVIDSDASAREIREAKKELTSVEKKIAELKDYDEKLHHMADQQIEIDLDDGVKVNYKKFEGLVAKI